LIAERSVGVPLTAVYLVSPRSIAAMPAAFTLSGVSKSGSPTVRSRTWMPSSRRLLARAAATELGEGWILVSRSASIVISNSFVGFFDPKDADPPADQT